MKETGKGHSQAEGVAQPLWSAAARRRFWIPCSSPVVIELRVDAIRDSGAKQRAALPGDVRVQALPLP